jgi:putative ABC transport system substrate-binding protein
MNNRRKLAIAVGTSAFISSLQLFAQQRPQPAKSIGLLARSSAASLAPMLDAFRKGLRDLGWVEGSNIDIEYRFAEGQVDRLTSLAADLVNRKVDVIVTVDTPPTQAAKQATNTIPIVIAVSADPVGAGLVSSLRFPGANVTGMSLLGPETDQKNLELIRETLPKARRVGMIWDPDNRGMTLRLNALKAAAATLAINLEPIAARDSGELENALSVVAKRPPDALIVLSPIYAAYKNEVVDFATRTKTPIAFDTSGLAGEPGALLSYGADIALLFRRAASHVDKILKGAKPADLPVEQPTKFELVVNMKTARMLRIKIPESIMLRADKLIE